MKRAIQQQLENPLAQAILSGHFVAGDTIQVDVEHETLRFLKQ
jgi:ATP-dependent Clp protease ATP-binding subunit ClpB